MTKPVPHAARRCAAHAWRLFARCRCAAGALRDDRSGNVTLIFALAIIPIVGAVAVAVDYSRGNAARTAMQAALDATTLMVSKEALDLKNAQVRQKAKSYFHAQFDRPDVRGLKLSFDMTTNGPGDFTIAGEATAKMDTALAQVIGYKKMDLRATSQVRWSFKSLELALALDNTGSMASKNKMVELKAAVKLLLGRAAFEIAPAPALAMTAWLTIGHRAGAKSRELPQWNVKVPMANCIKVEVPDLTAGHVSCRSLVS